MSINVLRAKSYNAVITKDESMILNIAGNASLWQVDGDELTKVGDFNTLKHSSFGAIAASKKVVALKNTSGKIAVHETKAGELLLKHNAVMCEGYGLFVVNDSKQILSSTWDCDVFMIDISSGKVVKEKVCNSEYHGAPILPGRTDNEFFIYCQKRNTQRNSLSPSAILKLTVSEESFCYEPISDMLNCCTSTPIKYQDSLLFSSDPSLSFSKLYLFSMANFEYREYIDVQQAYATTHGEKNNELQYVTHINSSTDGKYLVLVCKWSTILIIETSGLKCLRRIEHTNISNTLFFNNNKNLWVGTWEKVFIYDFLELVG